MFETKMLGCFGEDLVLALLLKVVLGTVAVPGLTFDVGMLLIVFLVMWASAAEFNEWRRRREKRFKVQEDRSASLLTMGLVLLGALEFEQQFETKRRDRTSDKVAPSSSHDMWDVIELDDLPQTSNPQPSVSFRPLSKARLSGRKKKLRLFSKRKTKTEITTPEDPVAHS